VIDWRKESGAGNFMEAVLSPRKAHIPKSVAFFRRALIEALDACGKDMSPRAGMPQVKAVDREIVRAEFLKAYPAKNRKAKEMAFLRCEMQQTATCCQCCHRVGLCEVVGGAYPSSDASLQITELSTSRSPLCGWPATMSALRQRPPLAHLSRTAKKARPAGRFFVSASCAACGGG
jgi:hypothetical protein